MRQAILVEPKHIEFKEVAEPKAAEQSRPCQMQSPVVDAVAESMGDQVKVCKVNVDEQQYVRVFKKNEVISTDLNTDVGSIKAKLLALHRGADAGQLESPAGPEAVPSCLFHDFFLSSLKTAAARRGARQPAPRFCSSSPSRRTAWSR